MLHPTRQHSAGPRASRIGNRTDVLLLVSALVVFPATAFAYIDPGYGALFVQVALSGLIGVSYFARRAIRGAVSRLASWLRRKPRGFQEPLGRG